MPTRWLVDGMNLIGSRPDGWWADRARAMRELVSELERFVAEGGDEVTVVFDGSASEERPAPGGAAAGRLCPWPPAPRMNGTPVAAPDRIDR